MVLTFQSGSTVQPKVKGKLIGVSPDLVVDEHGEDVGVHVGLVDDGGVPPPPAALAVRVRVQRLWAVMAYRIGMDLPKGTLFSAPEWSVVKVVCI